MPHVGSSSAEDLASSDEIKVFKDEGEDEDEKRACWTDLTDLKSSLITEGDQEKSSQAFSSKSSSSQSTHQNGQRSESTSNFGKPFESPLGYSPFSYPIPHPPYPNGTLGQMANKMAAAVVGAPHSGSPLPPFMMPNMERFPQPPPAHMGIPPVHIETKAVSISAWMDLDISGIGRNPLYNLSGHGHQYSHSVLSDFTQQLQWHNPAMYHQLQFRGPYSSLPAASTFPSFGRSHLPMPSLSGHSFSHPSFLPSSQSNHLNNNNNSPITNGLSNGQKTLSQSSPNNGTTANSNLLVNGSNNHSPQASSSHNRLGGSNSSLNSSSNIARNNHNNNNDISIRNKNKCNSNSFSNNGNSNGSNKQDKHSSGHSSDGHSDREHSSNKSHIKKPLNAFMIYMREMRAKVIAESTLKESAAINQILGKRWHGLSRVDQEKYYEKARKERELHMEMHPGWTAKDNYAINGKKKKKKRERNADGERGAMKKCRARYGLDQQNHWCKPCRRKKKCIRYMEAMRAANAGIKMENDDNLGSVGSVEAPTPESKSANESDHDNLNLSSTDLSLSSPPTSEYHHFINSFNNFSSSSAINSPTSGHLHLNGHGNGHSLHSSPSLFYSHHNPSVSATSLNSPIGSRMSSLLTPNSPLASSLSSFSSAQSMVPSLQAAVTPSQSQMPPRNSPFSIEQLARPHCPQNRSSPLSSFSSASPSFLNSTSNAKSNGSVTVSVITQLPTPPSSTDSTSATPAMLSVA